MLFSLKPQIMREGWLYYFKITLQILCTNQQIMTNVQ